jgi:RNA polymerase sigma-70 factor (ECF subfamily)
MLHPSEIEVVLDQVAQGNRDAFRKVVRAFGLPLRSFIASHVHHLDDVDDLAQEVFIAAYRSLPGFQRGDDFGSWLRGIARHKLQDYARGTARRARVLERFREQVARTVESDLERAVAADNAEVIEMLLACIARLPERMRRVVRAGLDGDKPAALAGDLATSVAAIYNLHYRANQLLRDCMHKGST